MKNIAVIYRSRYGSTKKYAQWLSKQFECELFETAHIKAEDLLKYDTIVFGGGLYAGGINGIAVITKNFEQIKDKNLIVFTVGLASTDDPTIFKPIIDKNLTKEMQAHIAFFHLRGGIDYSKLGPVHKVMMGMLKKMVQNKKELSDEDSLMLSTYGGRIDFADEASTQPLVSYVREINKTSKQRD
ncbi:flavodoxin domain-containing protein [Oscillospiraceae bacterium PP1C4]